MRQSPIMSATLPPPDRGRLTDLLLDPREALDVEIKGWLDLAQSDEHKAVLAKALLALANSGGGFVILGFAEGDTGAAPVPGRPVTLDAYSQDLVNAIVQNYAEPAFHARYITFCIRPPACIQSSAFLVVIVFQSVRSAAVQTTRSSSNTSSTFVVQGLEANSLLLHASGMSSLPDAWMHVVTNCLSAFGIYSPASRHRNQTAKSQPD